ncbi:hypothetical protein, partial [Rhizobium laguerreae]|uniref:hypothetical protein n=1 Tax=Rhizobium laguerreae TaxID=1076926 RepID=UPI001AEE0508
MLRILQFKEDGISPASPMLAAPAPGLQIDHGSRLFLRISANILFPFNSLTDFGPVLFQVSHTA